MSNFKKQVHLISNTHWDREWYLSLEKYRTRLIKMMDRLLKIMEEKPDYTFVTDGQFVLVQDYLNVRPEAAETVKKLMAENRLKVGPWYTQPLETLVTGEAMTRNLFYGIMETGKYGDAMKFSYMIDEFGHASQTPQILRGFGIDSAMAWRGIPDKTAAVFEWAAANGDSVTMHRSVHGYGEATALPTQMEDFEEVIDGTTFKRCGLKSKLDVIQSLKEPNAQVDVQFWLNGIDHSWAQEDILDVIKLVNATYGDEYDVKQTTLEEYNDAIKKAYSDKKIVMEKLTGELMHPDEEVLVCIHSIRADQKQEHYKAEHLLEQAAEPISAFAWLGGMDYPLWALQDAWKNVLENHAHDSLGCCSVDSVYTKIMARYDGAISTGEQLVDEGFAYLMSKDDSDLSVYILSTNSAKRSGAMVCSFDIPREFGVGSFDLLDEKGTKVAFHILHEQNLKSVRYNPQYGHPSNVASRRYHVVIALPEYSGIGCRRLSLVKTDTKPIEKPVEETTFGVLENEFFVVTIKENGCLNILDKRTNQQYVEQLQLADSGDKGCFYVHRRPAFNTVITNSNAIAEITKITQNDLLTEYEIGYCLEIPKTLTEDFHARSKEQEPLAVKIRVKLLRGAQRIDVQIEVDNRSRYHQLRVLFPTGMHMAKTSFSGQPFDIVEREIGVPQGFHDIAKDPNTEYHPMQDFCAIQGDEKGLLIAAKGIYEYEAVNDECKTLALTMFRTTEMDRQPTGDADDNKTVLSYLFKKMTYNLAIIPLSGDCTDAYPQVLDFTNPPRIMFKRSPDEALFTGYTKSEQKENIFENIIDVQGTHVYVTAIKKQDCGNMLIVRLLNLSKENQAVGVSLNPSLKACKGIYQMNLNEEKLAKISESGAAQFTIKSKEVYTLGFEFE